MIDLEKVRREMLIATILNPRAKLGEKMLAVNELEAKMVNGEFVRPLSPEEVEDLMDDVVMEELERIFEGDEAVVAARPMASAVLLELRGRVERLEQAMGVPEPERWLRPAERRQRDEAAGRREKERLDAEVEHQRSPRHAKDSSAPRNL